MKKLLLAISSTFVLAVANISPALAWHPEVEVVKKVQNQTTGSALVDANDASSAVATKPGDVIKYVIEVKNVGKPSSNGHNDLAFTVLTDSLPAGVELATNAAQRTINESLGTIKPGQKVTKEYQLKVTSQTDGAVIVNEACAKGDSTVKDHPVSDCDKAVIKVSITKEEPKAEVLPKEIVRTGPESALLSAFGVGTVGYGLHNYIRSRRALRSTAKQ